MNNELEFVAQKIRSFNWFSLFSTIKDGHPRTRAITHVLGEDLMVYYATYADSDKIKEIKDNPNVFVLMYSAWWDDYINIIGRCERVSDSETKRFVWEKLQHSTSKFFNNGVEDDRYLVIKVIPIQIEFFGDNGFMTVNL